MPLLCRSEAVTRKHRLNFYSCWKVKLKLVKSARPNASLLNHRTAFGILIYQAHSLPDIWHNPKLLYTKLIVSACAIQLEQYRHILGGLGRSYSHLRVGRVAHSQCGKWGNHERLCVRTVTGSLSYQSNSI